ncbi:hypothetical protein Tco_0211968 [Tanacetum coccineum]
MRTRSQSRNLHHQQQQAPPPVVEPFNLEEPIENPASPVVTMDDNRTMAQLLEAPTEGYEDAIVVPEITADNFELKHGLLNLVQNKQFFGHDKEDPHAHIRYFNKITSTMKFPNVPSTSLKDMVKALLLDKKIIALLLPTKAVEESYVTCGGTHSFPPAQNNQNNQGNNQNRYNQNRGNFNQASAYQPPVNQGQIYRPQVIQPPAYQAPTYQAPAPQIQGVSKEDFQAYIKANDAVMRNMQTQGQNMQNQLTNLTDMLSKSVTSNTASTSGTLPSNTITNPKDDLKSITTRSGVAYKGPTIPNDFLLLNNVNERPSAPMPNQKTSIPFPSRRNDERRREKANDQIEKFYEIFRDLSFEIAFTDALNAYAKFRLDSKTLIETKKKVLGFSNVISSGNPTPYYDPIVSTSSPTLTLFGHSDFLLFEEPHFSSIEENPTSPNDPSPPPPNQGNYFLEIPKDLKICEANNEKSSVNEPPEVELKDLPPHLEYAFLEGNDKLPVIIAKDLKNEEKAALIEVLKSHKRAIAWKLSDIKGIDPEFCTHKILMEEDYEPTVQHQRRVNPKIHDVIKKEVEKFLQPINLLRISTVHVFRDSFSTCLSHLGKMLKRCEDTNLVLNWEKSHFMVKECIVLRHKISKSGIEVDRAKVDVIAKLPHPTSVKDKLENKEITETFPLETLGSVALRVDSTPWFADFANYHAGNFIVKGMAKKRSDILEACHNGPTGGHHGANLTAKKDCPDSEASRARGFVLRSQELHILSFILGIRYPNLID